MTNKEAIQIVDAFLHTDKADAFYRNSRIIVECQKDDLVEFIEKLKIKYEVE